MDWQDSSLRTASNPCVDINTLNANGDSILHMAARADHKELVAGES